MKQFEITIKRDTLPIRLVTLEVPEQDITLVDLVLKLYKLYDCLIDIELSITESTCHKGCGICCKQLVPLTIPETFYMSNVVEGLTKERQVVIKRRFELALEKLKTTGWINSYTNPASNKNIDRDYFELQISCPFLESGICSIYEFRPFICRQYNLTSNPKFCINPYINIKNLQNINIECNIGALFMAFASRLYAIPAIQIPLILIPYWVDKNKYFLLKKWSGEWLLKTLIDGLVRFEGKPVEIAYTVLE